MSWATRQQQLGVTDGTFSNLLAVPNGAGPGTVSFGSEDCFVEWTVTTNRDRVPVRNVFHSGASNRDQVWTADGCLVQADVKTLTGFHYDDRGIQVAGSLQPRIWASWAPAASIEPRLDSWCLATGSDPAVYPLPELPQGVTARAVSPIGYCRYFSLRSSDAVSVLIQTDAPNATLYWQSVAGTEIAGPVEPWQSLVVRNMFNGTVNYSISFDRDPI